MLVDLDIAAVNTGRFQDWTVRYRVRVRPRIKTLRVQAIPGMKLGAGAAGMIRQKVSEAEAMTAAGAPSAME